MFRATPEGSAARVAAAAGAVLCDRIAFEVMATDNPLWGEERIANELLVKLGIRVSLRTVRKHMPKRPPRVPRGDQRWSSFLSNHAKAIIACDFFVAMTATLRSLYAFVVIHHATRQLLHVNVTAHPTAAWTLHQMREAVGLTDTYRYLIHERDSIFARRLDDFLERLGVKVVKSPPRSPMANAVCERVIGTIRRECLDWMIPLSEAHLRIILKFWVGHCNLGRPHNRLGPGIPEPPAQRIDPKTTKSRHHFGEDVAVLVRSVLGGLHHEYSLASRLR